MSPVDRQPPRARAGNRGAAWYTHPCLTVICVTELLCVRLRQLRASVAGGSQPAVPFSPLVCDGGDGCGKEEYGRAGRNRGSAYLIASGCLFTDLGGRRPGLGRAIVHDIGKIGANLAIHQRVAPRCWRAGWSDWRRQADEHAERAASRSRSSWHRLTLIPRAGFRRHTACPQDFERLP